jgi:uncharacterized membrane protein
MKYLALIALGIALLGAGIYFGWLDNGQNPYQSYMRNSQN